MAASFQVSWFPVRRSSKEGGIVQDKPASRATALDDVGGRYHVDAGWMDEALSSALAYHRVVSSDVLWHVDKEWMVIATGEGCGRIDRPDTGRRGMALLDVSETMDSVKTVSERDVDYLHLARVDGQQRIVDVLWDSWEQEQGR